MGRTGCTFLTVNVSTFMETEFEDHFNDHFDVTITLTEEGTGESVKDPLKTCSLLQTEHKTLYLLYFKKIFHNSALRIVSLCLDISMVKSERIRLSFLIGNVEILDSPKSFKRGKVIEGTVCCCCCYCCCIILFI